LFKIPTLKELSILNNELGKKGVLCICEILKESSTLESLEFGGDFIYSSQLDSSLNEMELMTIFKESVMESTSLSKLFLEGNFTKFNQRNKRERLGLINHVKGMH
jgi:hypothetical protein